MSHGRHRRKIVAACGQATALVTSWAHPFDQGMTARVQQIVAGSSLRLRALPLLLIGLLVLIIGLIG